jgi:hypothetical protein
MPDKMYKHSSYHIYSLDNERYGLLASGVPVLEGSLAQVCATMVKKFHLPMDQIEHALLKMHDRDHNMAEFNMFGTYISTLGCKKKKAS